jgi:hypothetical protein
MSISALSLMKNATSGTVTGGTAMALSSDGEEVKNGVHVADMSESDFTIRTNMTLRTRNPVKQPDGSYSKGKRWMTIVVPKSLDDGSIVFNLVRQEMEIHPKTTTAEIANIELLASQMWTDSDLSDFRRNGSLS